MNLSQDEHEALLELFNIGVGRAALALNELVGKRIRLSVPRLEITGQSELQRISRVEPDQEICVVEQEYTCSFSGRASLIFPSDAGGTLVQLLADDDDDDLAPEDLGALKMGTLSEVGNILINALMGSISNLLGETLTYSIPKYTDAVARDIFQPSDDESACICCTTKFVVADLELEGFFVTYVSVDAMSNFVASLAKSLDLNAA